MKPGRDIAEPDHAVAPAEESAKKADSPSITFAHIRWILPNLFDTMSSLLTLIVTALFVLTFLVQPFRIPSESMERTLLVGDFVLVNKSVFGPAGHWNWLLPYRQVAREDVVVFYYPLEPTDHVVKRVIGDPGDRIRIDDHSVYVDGEKLREPYAVFEGAYQDHFSGEFPSLIYTEPGINTRWWRRMRNYVRNGELVTPAGEYFVLGDNRNYSRDSRYWGFVPRNNIVGMPFLIYFSVREPSGTDTGPTADDRLGYGNDWLEEIMLFARWDRILKVIH